MSVRKDMPRTHRAVALCAALVVFAAFVPAAAATLVIGILAPLWLIVPAVAVTVVRRRARGRGDVQPASLLWLDGNSSNAHLPASLSPDSVRCSAELQEQRFTASGERRVVDAETAYLTVCVVLEAGWRVGGLTDAS